MVCSWMGNASTMPLAASDVDDVLIDAEFGEGRHDVCLSGSEMLPGFLPGRGCSLGRGRRAGGSAIHALLSHRRGRPDPTPGTLPTIPEGSGANTSAVGAS